MIRVETVSWYWHRLRAMDSAEIAGRIAEKTRGFNERRSLAQLKDFRLGPPQPASARWLPDPASASDTLRDAIAANAAAVREGRWQLYGWKEVAMPDPPAWDWDAVHDRRAPLEAPIAALNHRQLASGADPRSIWEINRWSELVRLAQNAWLNGRIDDARLAQRWLADWLERNALGHGINWTSPLEAALRLLHFTWIDTLLRASEDAEVRAEQTRLAARIVPAHAWWVWRHRSFGSSANNHLLGELAALTVAGRRWPCLMHVACCAEKAWQKLQEETLRQFAPDGGNREQALHYHLFAWSLVWQARQVMGPGGTEFERQLKEAVRYFHALAQPREPWDFGDSDDAEITAFTTDRQRELVEWKAWFESAGEALNFWFGPSPSLPGSEDTTTGWRLFPDSGLAVKKAGSWTARFDASPLGFGSMAAHGHLDALHVSLWHGDHAVLIDPGTGAYYSDPELRARLADWEAHNAPVPETGRHAPRRAGTFLWSQHHEPPRLREEEEAATACLACDGPFVKRQVRLHADGFEVLDRICTDTPHLVTWTLAPGWQVLRTGNPHHFCLAHREGHRLRLAMESETLQEVNIIETVVSPRFGQTVSAPAIRVRFTGIVKTQVKLA